MSYIAIEFQGKTYKSLKSLCKEFNVCFATFKWRKSNGATLEQCLGIDISIYSNIVIFEGVAFKSLAELLRHYEIPNTTYWGRMKRGLTIRQALGIDPYRPSYARWREMGLCNEEGVIVEKANYLLYEIKNKINGKIYIGMATSTLKHRWGGHVQDSKTKQTPLYKAMRKYGIENFEIYLLRNDAKSGVELMKQETEEIKNKNTTDRNIGYNVASGGSKGNSKQFMVDNKLFPSQQEAATHFGINIGAFNKRIRDGWTPEQAAGIEPKSTITRHWVFLHGKKMNLTDAARILNKKERTIHTRIIRGWTYRQAFDLEPPPHRNSHCARKKPNITNQDRLLG